MGTRRKERETDRQYIITVVELADACVHTNRKHEDKHFLD